MSTLQFGCVDFESQPFCVAGKPLMRRVEFGQDGSEVVTWRNLDGTEATPAAADLAAATPGACAAAAVPPKKAVATIKREEVTTAGNTPADAESVSILNVGSKVATVDGTPLLPGEASNWKAWLDPVANEFKLLPPIAYDPGSSTLHIQWTI